MDFDEIIITLLVSLTMIDVHNKEVLIEFFQRNALHKHCRHKIVLLLLAHTHLLAVFGLSKDVVSLQNLAQVTNHETVDISFAGTVLLDHNCDLLGHGVANRVIKHIVILHFGSSQDLLFREHSFLIHLSEHDTNVFEAECASNLFDLVSLFVLNFGLSRHVADLWWVVHTFDIASDAFGVVGVLTVVPV